MHALKQQIEKHYGFTILAHHPAPRGFCAETFVFATDKGPFFAKIFSNLRLIQNLSTSLRCQAQIARAVDYVPAPIATMEGQFFFQSTENRIVSLYAYIDGTSYHADTPFELVHLMAKIYSLHVASARFETFPVCLQKEYQPFWNGTLPLSKTVADFVNCEHAFIAEKWQDYCALCARIRHTKEGFHLTHGDMPGNLMVDNAKKVFIIDWDDACMAPIERDFWEYMASPAAITALQASFLKEGISWQFNEAYYDYYLLTRFFDDLYGYMELDIFQKEDSRSLARKIQTEVFDWLFPLLRHA